MKGSKKKGTEPPPLDPVSLSTWARLRSAGKIAKPHEAEVSKPRKKGKKR